MPDRKLTALSQHLPAALTSDDLMLVTDDPSGVPASKKVTLGTVQDFIADRPLVLAADGTGDYTALADAVAALSEGDVLFIKNGTYAGGVTIATANVTLIGESKTKTIIQSPATSTPCITITADNVTFENFKIDGLRDGRTGNPDLTQWAGIRLTGANYFTARYLWVFEVYGFGISADNASHYGRVFFCNLEDRATDPDTPTEGGYAGNIRLSGSDHWLIAFNYITGEAQSVGFWWGANDNMLAFNHIVDNYGYSDAAHTIPRSAFEDYGSTSTNYRNIAIGNVIDGTTGACIESAQGVYSSQYISNILMSHGAIGGKSLIVFTGQTGELNTRNLLQNCCIVGDGSAGGIIVGGGSGAVIDGNIIYGMTAGAGAFNIGVRDAVMINNIFSGTRYPVRTPAGEFNLLFARNITIDSTRMAYLEAGGSKFNIRENIAKNTAAPEAFGDTASICANVVRGGGVAAASNTVIEQNYIHAFGGSLAVVLSLGSYCTVRHNTLKEDSAYGRDITIGDSAEYVVLNDNIIPPTTDIWGGTPGGVGRLTYQAFNHTETFSRQEQPKALGEQTVGTSQATIAHGLAYAPTEILITMTSDGTIRKSAASDATNIYLTADAAGRTAEIFVR